MSDLTGTDGIPDYDRTDSAKRIAKRWTGEAPSPKGLTASLIRELAARHDKVRLVLSLVEEFKIRDPLEVPACSGYYASGARKDKHGNVEKDPKTGEPLMHMHMILPLTMILPFIPGDVLFRGGSNAYRFYCRSIVAKSPKIKGEAIEENLIDNFMLPADGSPRGARRWLVKYLPEYAECLLYYAEGLVGAADGHLSAVGLSRLQRDLTDNILPSGQDHESGPGRTKALESLRRGDVSRYTLDDDNTTIPLGEPIDPNGPTARDYREVAAQMADLADAVRQAREAIKEDIAARIEYAGEVERMQAEELRAREAKAEEEHLKREAEEAAKAENAKAESEGTHDGASPKIAVATSSSEAEAKTEAIPASRPLTETKPLVNAPKLNEPSMTGPTRKRQSSDTQGEPAKPKSGLGKNMWSGGFLRKKALNEEATKT